MSYLELTWSICEELCGAGCLVLGFRLLWFVECHIAILFGLLAMDYSDDILS
jgi:hypothetical protein